MNPTISGVVAILQLFFSKNPTVEDILQVIEQVGPALAAEKAGQAFSLSFPITLGVAGTAGFSFTPTAKS